jgi:hypothetical protein
MKHALEDLRMSEPSVAASGPGLWPWAVTTVLAIALAATAVLLYQARRSIPHPLVRISAELTPRLDRAFRLDAETILYKGGPGTSLAFSPDGTRLAISVRDVDGKVRLATRQLDQSRFVPLPGSENSTAQPLGESALPVEDQSGLTLRSTTHGLVRAAFGRMDASAVNQTRILVGDSESFTSKRRRRAGLSTSAGDAAVD